MFFKRLEIVGENIYFEFEDKCNYNLNISKLENSLSRSKFLDFLLYVIENQEDEDVCFCYDEHSCIDYSDNKLIFHLNSGDNACRIVFQVEINEELIYSLERIYKYIECFDFDEYKTHKIKSPKNKFWKFGF